MTELAGVIWAVQMSTVEFHPWNSGQADTERPDGWRIDLDPGPACGFGTVRRVARVVRELLGEAAAAGCAQDLRRQGPARLGPDGAAVGFADMRRAARAFACEVERRAPDLVTAT